MARLRFDRFERTYQNETLVREMLLSPVHEWNSAGAVMLGVELLLGRS